MIDHYSFGNFVIHGHTFNSNIKLIDDVAKPCRHFDGHIIKKSDFDDLIEAKPDIIIIGTGQSGVVNVPDDIIGLIEGKGIELIIKKTAEACLEYNKLIKRKKNVCALLHNTC